MIMPPCKDCHDRHQACWGDCASYKLWKAEQDGMLSDFRKKQDTDAFIRDGYNKRKEPFIKK